LQVSAARDALPGERQAQHLSLEKEAVKAPTLLIAFGLTLLPTFLMTAGTAGVSYQTS